MLTFRENLREPLTFREKSLKHLKSLIEDRIEYKAIIKSSIMSRSACRAVRRSVDICRMRLFEESTTLSMKTENLVDSSN
jgi:hypothetical protein